MGAPYIYDISHLRVKEHRFLCTHIQCWLLNVFQCTCGVQVADACFQWSSSPRATTVSLGHDSSLWFTRSPSSSCRCYHQLPQGQPPIGWHVTQCRGMASWQVLQTVTKVSVTLSQLILDWLLISTDSDTLFFKTKLRQQNKITYSSLSQLDTFPTDTWLRLIFFCISVL